MTLQVTPKRYTNRIFFDTFFVEFLCIISLHVALKSRPLMLRPSLPHFKFLKSLSSTALNSLEEVVSPCLTTFHMLKVFQNILTEAVAFTVTVSALPVLVGRKIMQKNKICTTLS